MKTFKYESRWYSPNWTLSPCKYLFGWNKESMGRTNTMHFVQKTPKNALLNWFMQWNNQIITYTISIIFYTVKPVYNGHLMGYLSAFWSSSRWHELKKADIVTKSKLVPSVLIETHYWINQRYTFYFRGGRYRQVSLYFVCISIKFAYS